MLHLARGCRGNWMEWCDKSEFIHRTRALVERGACLYIKLHGVGDQLIAMRKGERSDSPELALSARPTNIPLKSDYLQFDLEHAHFSVSGRSGVAHSLRVSIDERTRSQQKLA